MFIYILNIIFQSTHIIKCVYIIYAFDAYSYRDLNGRHKVPRVKWFNWKVSFIKLYNDYDWENVVYVE